MQVLLPAGHVKKIRQDVEGYISYMCNDDDGAYYEELLNSEYTPRLREAHEERCRLEQVRRLLHCTLCLHILPSLHVTTVRSKAITPPGHVQTCSS